VNYLNLEHRMATEYYRKIHTEESDIVTCVPIARQRVGKRIPAENARKNRTLLLGNGAVNTH
jgi:hypothetical protein